MADVAGPVVAPRSEGRVRGLIGKQAAWIAATVASVVVTLLKLGETYEGFFLSTLNGWTLALIVVNIAATFALIVALQRFLQPQRKVWFAVIVAASAQALVNSSFETGLVGADQGTQVAAMQEVSIGEFYNPLESRLTRRIEDPVRAERLRLIDALVAAYPNQRGVDRLGGRFIRHLGVTNLVPADQVAGIRERIEATMKDVTLTPTEKAEMLGTETLNIFGRSTLERLTREGAAG